MRKIQFLEHQAEQDVVPFDDLIAHLGREPGSGPIFRVCFFDETDSTQRSFLQSTSSTTDMTIFVTSPQELAPPGSKPSTPGFGFFTCLNLTSLCAQASLQLAALLTISNWFHTRSPPARPGARIIYTFGQHWLHPPHDFDTTWATSRPLR